MITNTEACAETLSAFPRKFRFSSIHDNLPKPDSYHITKTRTACMVCKPFQISVCVYTTTMLYSNLITTVAFNANLEGDRYSSRTE